MVQQQEEEFLVEEGLDQGLVVAPKVKKPPQITAALVGEVVAALSAKRFQIPGIGEITEITFLDPSQALELGVTIEEGFQIKLTPGEERGTFTTSLITPEGWEITQDDLFISPEGQTFTRAEIEALPEAPPPEFPAVAPIAPLVSPTGRTIEQLLEQLAGDMPVPERIRAEEELATLQAELATTPEAQFIAEIDALSAEWRARILIPGEFSKVVQEIKEIFPLITEDQIRSILGQLPEEARELIKTIWPEESTAVIAQFDFSETKDGFFAAIQQEGRTDDTENLLKAIYPEVTEEQLNEVFGGAGSQIEVQESFWKNVWDSFYLSARRVFHQTGKFFTTVLPETLFQDVKPGGGLIPGVEIEGAGFTEEQAVAINQANKEKRDEFRVVSADKQEGFEDWLEKNPQLQPAEGENWINIIASALPFTLAVLATTAATFFATKNPTLAIAAGTAVATPSQSQDLFDDLIASGAPEDAAAQIALPVGVLIASVEAVTDLPLMKAIFPGFSLLRPAIQKAVVRATVKELIKKGVKTFTVVEIVEVMEEVVQGAIHNAFVKIFDENRAVFENVDTTIINTLIATLPFAIFGAGVSMRPVSREEVSSTLPKDRTGWERDIHGQWFKPVSMVKTYNELVQEFEAGGLTTEQAKRMALNELARSPEGEKAIGEAANKLQAGEELPKAPLAEVVFPEQGIYRVGDKFTTPQGDVELDLWVAAERKWAIKLPDGTETKMTLTELDEVTDPKTGTWKKIPEPVEAVPAVEEAPEATELRDLHKHKARVEGLRNVSEVEARDYLKRIRELAIKEAPNEAPNIDEAIRALDEGDLGAAGVAADTALSNIHQRYLVQHPEFDLTRPPVAEAVPLAEVVPPTAAEAVESKIKEQAIEKPLVAKTELTDKQVRENEQLIGQPKLTLKQVDALTGFFADYLIDPNAATAWELTRELRREARAQRAKSLEERVQELIISEGVDTEAAIKQATQETMSGELPVLQTEYLQGLTDELRDALFAKVYHVLKNEPFEMMSTAEALTNALTGKPIPREPGVKGGSAYSRLQRVFGDQPKVIRMIDKMAKERKSLDNIIEGVFRVSGQDPIPVDPKMAEYLRNLSTVPMGQAWLLSDAPAVLKLSETRSEEQIRAETDLLRIELANEPVAVTQYELPIEEATKQIPLWPTPIRDSVVKVLKEIGWSPIDIGNFIRANKASFDFSFWRQQGPLIFNHPVTFLQSNIEAWKSIFSQKAAEGSWERITRDPLFQIYDVAADAGFDFLRPLTLLKGTSQWQGVEEFGYLTGERTIPRFTMKIPWIKISSRAFITGTNGHNWRIFKNHHQAMLKLNEKYASGELTLREGQVFSVEKEMVDMAKMLADFTQRASLGKAAGLAPAINALMFSPRATLGRLLTPRHLISKNPRVRIEAWRNIVTFVGVIGGIVLLGWRMGLWEVERDPRSGEYMSIRIGNTRIDPWSGYRQFLVFFTRIITDLFTNKKGGMSSVTGAEYELNPIGSLTSFLRGKAAPLASILLDFWIGKNFIGEEVDIANKRQWAERIAPFAVWDIYEAVTENNLEIGLGVTIPAILGLGVQTYTGDWVENFAKLGLPKYEENLPYGLDMPKYDTQDFWADHAGEFRDVDPATLTEAKGFPAFIRALVEAIIIKEHLATLSNVTLVSLNADPDKGITFGQYYQMWRDREKLVAEGDEEKLKEFDADERTRNAHLGNMSQRQYALLVEYHFIIDPVEQAEFLEEHKAEIGINPRHDWLKSHPKENAQLAIWGQAKVLTLEAYKETKKLLKELDIPDAAIPEFTLPPETSIETHFAYEDFVADGKHASWEAQLLLKKDAEAATEAGVESYVEWRGLTLSDTPLRALELQVQHRELFDEYNGYADRDSPFYIENTNDRTEARDKLRADNPEWVDDTRRIEAIENLASDEVIEEWVERGRIVDEFSGGSSEAKVWLVDHPETWKWALEQELLTDDGSDWNVPVLRINAEWREQDDEYDAIQFDDEKEQREARERYLEAHPEYAKARRRRDAWNFGFPAFLIEDYVNYYLLTTTAAQNQFLIEHGLFYSMALQLLGWKPRKGITEGAGIPISGPLPAEAR